MSTTTSGQSLSPDTSSSSNESTSSTINNLPSEEIKERNKAICLVIKGLASWLLKSSLAPRSGNSLTSLYEQVGRNKTPAFLASQLGRQYCHVKTSLETFSRANMFTRLNSISIGNNANLLYMLDPILIGEFDRKHRQQTGSSASSATTSNMRDQQDSLNSLFQTSTSLSQRDHFNVLFSANIERVMVANLPGGANSADSYFYFTQVSLEGLLKFLGQWNREYAAAAAAAAAAASSTNSISGSVNTMSKLQEKTANLAESILSNIVSSGNSAVDEVSAKTANAFNSIIRLAENLTADDKSQQQTSASRAEGMAFGGQQGSDDALNQQPQYPMQSFANAANIQRSFNRNNLDIGM
jgi:hypothetical protein